MTPVTHRVWVDLQDHLGVLIDMPTRVRLRDNDLIALYRLGVWQLWLDILETVLCCRVRP